MTTRKVMRGQTMKQPRAADENAKALSADSYRRGPDGTPEREQPVSPVRVELKNSSGADREKGECLRVSPTLQLTTTIREQIICDGAAPNGTLAPFAILQEPIVSTKYGTGVIHGISLATVNVANTNHLRAYLPDGEYVLKSCQYGPVTILQRPAAIGEQTCVVLLRQENPPVWRLWGYDWEITEGNIYDNEFGAATVGYYADHPGFSLSGSALTCDVPGRYLVSVWFDIVMDISSVWPVAGVGYALSGFVVLQRAGPTYIYPGDTKSRALLYYVPPTTGDVPKVSAFYQTVVSNFNAGDIVGISANCDTAVPVGKSWIGDAVIGIGPRLWKQA